MNWTFVLIGFALGRVDGGRVGRLCLATIRPRMEPSRRRQLIAASVLPAITARCDLARTFCSSRRPIMAEANRWRIWRSPRIATFGGGFALLALIGSADRRDCSRRSKARPDDLPRVRPDALSGDVSRGRWASALPAGRWTRASGRSMRPTSATSRPTSTAASTIRRRAAGQGWCFGPTCSPRRSTASPTAGRCWR